MSQIRDLRAIPIIEMLFGTEDFDQWDSSIPNPIEPDRGQPMIDEEVRGERAFHLIARRHAGPASIRAALQPSAVIHDDLDARGHQRSLVIDVKSARLEQRRGIR